MGRIVLASFSDSRGGAAKAALRYCESLNKHGIQVDFVVADKRLQGSVSIGPSWYSYSWHFLLRLISFFLLKFFYSPNPIKHSLNLFNSFFVLNKVKGYEFIHLHWINNETLSIKNVALLSRSHKVIVTLHDEWFYSGAEHCIYDHSETDVRYITGYTVRTRDEYGIDWNKIVWSNKLKYIKDFDNIIFTVPSSWMKMRAASSMLLKNADIRVIPNPIPTSIFQPINKNSLGERFADFSKDKFIILFGASGGTKSPNKGWDLLMSSMDILWYELSEAERSRILLIVVGGRKINLPNLKFSIQQIGHVSTEAEMAALYSSVDITVVPSRVESFGQVAAESLACATPVVAYNCTGLMDVIDHLDNGYLAIPYCVDDFKKGIKWLFNMDICQRRALGLRGVNKVNTSFSERTVATKLAELYH